MSHSIKQTHSSAGIFQGNCHVGGHSPKISRHISSVHHDGANIVNNGGPARAINAHGGSGNKGIPISKQSSFSQRCRFGSVHGSYGQESHRKSFGGPSGRKNDGMLSANEKETMQLLNDRLASYLEKVHSVEQANTHLERNIREWYERNKPSTLPDFNHYFGTIEELQNKILMSTVENARSARQIENACLTADDFRNKYELEVRLRNNVDADVNNLRRDLDELDVESRDLDMQHQNLQEEMLCMKKSNEDAVNNLRSQLGARVNVEVDAAPAVDLNILLAEIRDQYEDLMEKNKIEAETWFIAKSEELKREVGSGCGHLQTIQSEVIDLKCTSQTLEIDLQSQLSMKSALEGTLAEKKASYHSQLAQLQCLINNVESQLAHVRTERERQNHEYNTLMDVTMHLEREIATYRRLLDKQDIHVPRPASHGKEGCQKGVTFLSITEEVESRKILSPREDC
ncbi:keratin, type I cytoskeletal 19-like [Ascaphus truei]|uniref:keratin, type I cytoskeletal 19-like n=1 Tax=Ascaphus truei TaxID=8439 RepID=UPI003F59E842